LEGSAALVARAKQSAELNGLDVEFGEMNLFEINEFTLPGLGHFDKWLIDPPRDGALELVKAITPETAPGRIVYISCNPATLARDAAILVEMKGYRLTAAGAVNMFPHTAHVESIAVFDRD
jgi:23S rRNA (uracil1939-C5)-methyltransferase